MDAFQQRELIFNGLFQIPFFKNEQVSVSLQFSQQAAETVCPCGNGIAQFGIHAGNGTFRQILRQFLIVVNENQRHHRTGADIFIPDLIQFRQIHKIQHRQHGAPVVLCPDGGTVNPVTAAAEGHILRTLGLAGCQPFGGKVRKDFIQLLFHHGIGITGQFTEPVIGPDNAAVSQTNQHRRQRTFALGSRFQGIGSFLNILLNLAVPTVPVGDIKHKYQKRHRSFRSRQQIIPFQQCSGTESSHHKKIRAHSGAKQSSKLPVHFFSAS